MNKAFTNFQWENDPSVNTPLSAENLNKVNNAVNEIDNRVINFDTTKANQTDMLTTIVDVKLNESNGVFTFTRKNGTTIELDTKLEKVVVNFSFDAETQILYLNLQDGTKLPIDLSAFITNVEFENTATIRWEKVAGGKMKAYVIGGSITADMIEPNYLANVQLYAGQAMSSANSAKTSAEEAEASAVRAEEAADKATEIAGGDFATNTKVDNIINGTTPAGNALKVNGVIVYNDFTEVDSTFSNQTPLGEINNKMQLGSILHATVWNGSSAIYPEVDGFLEIHRSKDGYSDFKYIGRHSGKIWTSGGQEDIFTGWVYSADGGNADTVDGKHASDFMANSLGECTGADLLTWLKSQTVGGYFTVNPSVTTSGCPVNGAWYYGFLGVGKGTHSVILFRSYQSGVGFKDEMYFNSTSSGTWRGWKQLIDSGGGILNGTLALMEFVNVHAASSNDGTYSSFIQNANGTHVRHVTDANNFDEFFIRQGKITYAKMVNGAWSETDVLHTGNSAKVVVSQTPLTTSDSIRVW